MPREEQRMNAHLGTACLGWDGSTLTQHVQIPENPGKDIKKNGEGEITTVTWLEECPV